MTGIQAFHEDRTEARAGDNVGLLLRGMERDVLTRGMLIVVPGSQTGEQESPAQAACISPVMAVESPIAVCNARELMGLGSGRMSSGAMLAVLLLACAPRPEPTSPGRTAFPAALDPLLSPEFGVNAVTPAAHAGADRAPAVAFDGTNFLVVWDGQGSGADVFATRVTPTGAVLDPSGFVISGAPSNGSGAAVAFNGTDYLVAWVESPPLRVVCARVSPAGVLLDRNPIVLASLDAYFYGLDVASVGSQWLVAWSDSRNGSTIDLFGARVTGAGAALDPLGGFPISAGSSRKLGVDLSAGGGNYFAVWQDDKGSSYDIYGARISTSGTVLDPAGLPLYVGNQDQIGPAVAFDGAQFLVAWLNSSGANVTDVYGSRFSTAGVLMGAANFPIQVSGPNEGSLTAGFGGGNFTVAWRDLRSGNADVYGTRVGPTGAVLDPGGVPLATGLNAQDQPALAIAGSQALLVWEDLRSSIELDIYGATFDPSSLTPQPAAGLISLRGRTPEGAVAATDGSNWLVVWRDFRVEPAGDIFAALVDGSGTLLTPTALGVATLSGPQSQPAVAWTGSDFLVVWVEGEGTAANISGGRISGQGALLDSIAGFPVATQPFEQSAPTLVSNGAGALAVWQDFRTDAGATDLYATRITSSGSVLDPGGIAVSAAPEWQSELAVGWNGAEYLVAWRDTRSVRDGDLNAARLSALGLVLDPLSFPVATPAGRQGAPAIAAIGADYFVAFESQQTGGDTDLLGIGVSSTGALLGSAAVLSSAAGDQAAPSICAVGGRYLLTWEDARSGPADIMATYLDGAGVAPVGGEFLVASGVTNELASAVACDATRGLVTWSGADVRARIVEYGDGGVISVTDGGVSDGGLDDGGLNDGGLNDGGLNDGGLDDGGLDDGGLDGGLDDGGLSNGGLDDGGLSDGGINNRGPRHYTVGCACGSADPSALAVFALALFARASRRRRASPSRCRSRSASPPRAWR